MVNRQIRGWVWDRQFVKELRSTAVAWSKKRLKTLTLRASFPEFEFALLFPELRFVRSLGLYTRTTECSMQKAVTKRMLAPTPGTPEAYSDVHVCFILQ